MRFDAAKLWVQLLHWHMVWYRLEVSIGHKSNNKTTWVRGSLRKWSGRD